MRKILLLFVTIISLYSLNAQTPACVPDPLYKDSAVGIYPPPYDASVSPNGGIKTPACLGKAYNFRFTIKVSDTISTALGRYPIDSISVNKTGSITGLPTGISYACNPPSCSFVKNTSGCVILTGTPATSNTPDKDYELVIKGNLFSPTFRLLGLYPYPIEFPSSTFPGSYKLTLLKATDPKCTSASANDLLGDVESLKNYPNPVANSTLIEINAVTSGQYQMTVYNSFGQRVHNTPLSLTSGLNTFELNTQGFANGIYIYTLSKNGKTMSNKFIVNK